MTEEIHLTGSNPENEEDRTGLCTVRELIEMTVGMNTDRGQMIVPADGHKWRFVYTVARVDRPPVPLPGAGDPRVDALEKAVLQLQQEVISLQQQLFHPQPQWTSPMDPPPGWVPPPIVTCGEAAQTMQDAPTNPAFAKRFTEVR